eukprot:359159-Chlamydomonas_euryale.AAC.27
MSRPLQVHCGRGRDSGEAGAASSPGACSSSAAPPPSTVKPPANEVIRPGVPECMVGEHRPASSVKNFAGVLMTALGEPGAPARRCAARCAMQSVIQAKCAA